MVYSEGMSEINSDISLDEHSWEEALLQPAPDYRCKICVDEHTKGNGRRRYSARLMEGDALSYQFQHHCELEIAEDSSEIFWERKRPAWFNYLMSSSGKKRKLELDSTEDDNGEPAAKKARKIIMKIKCSQKTYRIIANERKTKLKKKQIKLYFFCTNKFSFDL